MTTITVCATAGSAPACPVPPEGVPAEPFCPADAGAVAPGPDGELADEELGEVAGPADPHAASTNTMSTSTGSASTRTAGSGVSRTAGHAFMRCPVSCAAP